MKFIKNFEETVKPILKKLSNLREIFYIVSIFRWNFGSVLMRLSRISMKVFTNILLGLRENFENILGGF